jgi:hypothetical protein
MRKKQSRVLAVRVAQPQRWCRAEMLSRADAILSAPPASQYTERHAGRGKLVVRFALPLELAKPANSTRHAKGWMMARHRADVLDAMRAQWRFKREPIDVTLPLPGRPMIRCIRFSSTDPDATAAWWKTCVDVLLLTRTRRTRRGIHVVDGIGLLADDRPGVLETRAWHEAVPRGHGFALIEVWTGDDHEHV